ncbi:MAG: PQQ-dependent sugar dehydrogenase [Myxococcota bacterium]|nr:PQQ-dependent sugar dehydrogenase [Myxococcota bacterium]
MNRLRQAASALMILSGVTHAFQFLFWEPSPSNTPVGAFFGLLFLVIGAWLLRPGAAGPWLGAIVAGASAALGGLVAIGHSEPLSLFHLGLAVVVSAMCLILLFQRGTLRVLVVATTVALLCVGAGVVFLAVASRQDAFTVVYDEQCSVCHGENLEGLALGPPLVGRELTHGDSLDEIVTSIAAGFPAAGMPAGAATLDAAQIRALAILIVERRSGFDQTDLKVRAPLEIPEGTIRSERHGFRLEVVASGLHPLPFSIAPLPDGRILLTEKTRGLRFVSAEGDVSERIAGTPPAHGDGMALPDGLVYGHGWLLDVAPHPDFEDNGWLYLHFGDRCEDCETSMNKVVRARIEDGRWVDEQTIWQADPRTYTASPDIGAGGRIAFDDEGHLFLTVGIKGHSNHHGIQDLALPYGKIHRVHDDGRIPDDNPFVDTEGALPTIWTYGHRSPQGLEFDPESGRLWSTEMGPRGGDELNLLLPGRNYGWPLTSKGLNYDGTVVDYGKQLGIELDPDALEPPVLDMTPAPAISSFVLYRGREFPEWTGDVIVGSLKATALYRWVLEAGRVVHRETLLDGLARIRDVETGPDGAIYLLLEHGSGGQIVRMVAE